MRARVEVVDAKVIHVVELDIAMACTARRGSLLSRALVKLAGQIQRERAVRHARIVCASARVTRRLAAGYHPQAVPDTVARCGVLHTGALGSMADAWNSLEQPHMRT